MKERIPQIVAYCVLLAVFVVALVWVTRMGANYIPALASERNLGIAQFALILVFMVLNALLRGIFRRKK